MMILDTFVKFTDSRETILNKFQKILLYGIAFFIFLPFPYFFNTESANILGYHSDFTSIVAFPSFFLVCLLLITEVYRNLRYSENFINFYNFWLISGIFWISYHVTISTPLSAVIAYSAFKIFCALTVGYYVYKSSFWLNYKDFILWVIIILGSANAILAGIQFLLGNSIGLHLIGESPLSIDGSNIAKLIAHGTKYLRGYGFMPHPNILSGMLVIVTSLNLYLLNKYSQAKSEVILYLTLFLGISGVFFTFSRAGIAALLLVIITWGIYSLKVSSVTIGKTISSALVWCVVLGMILWPWISGRASISDPAVTERVLLNTATVELLEDHWLVGTGPGSNIIVLHGKLYGQVEAWVIQPVHNFWLITLSDLGLLGYVILIPIIAIVLMALTRFIGSESPSLWLTTLLAALIGVIFLFWFDHYFYTYWPPQLLLWLILGMTAKEVYSQIYLAKLFHGKQ